jgi:hypothetical protein
MMNLMDQLHKIFHLNDLKTKIAALELRGSAMLVRPNHAFESAPTSPILRPALPQTSDFNL